MNDALKPATGGWQTKQRLTLLPVLAGTTGGWQTKQRLTLLPVLVNSTTANKDIKYCQNGEQNLPRIVDAISYKSAIRPMMQSKSRPWKNVDGDKYDSHKGPFMDMLQTHDYVANAVRGDVEVDDKRRTRILKTRIRRFVGDDLHG